MERGFGIDAVVPADLAAEVAVRVEELGYGSFWVNGSPAEGALDVLQVASAATSLPVGVGVFPLTRIGTSDLVAEVRRRRLPQGRLWLGVGSNRRPGALRDVREAVATLRGELDATVVTAAVGPQMTRLGGELADAVIFTWWPRGEVARSRELMIEGAHRADRPPPVLVSYVRSALLPDAADAVAEKAAHYQSVPNHIPVFARNGVTAAETVVTGRDRADLLAGIEVEEALLDISVIRAITADNAVESLVELAEACAP